MGTRQSGGRSQLRILKVTKDIEVIEQARRCAEEIVETNDCSGWIADMKTIVDLRSDDEWSEG